MVVTVSPFLIWAYFIALAAVNASGYEPSDIWVDKAGYWHDTVDIVIHVATFLLCGAAVLLYPVLIFAGCRLVIVATCTRIDRRLVRLALKSNLRDDASPVMQMVLRRFLQWI